MTVAGPVDESFYVQCTGQIESGDFGPLDNLYCRYSFHLGNDWTIASVRVFYRAAILCPSLTHAHSHSLTPALLTQKCQGIDTGLSQTAMKAPMGVDDGVVWNFPIDVTFKSTNVHGWPRLALSTYGIDPLGRDVVRGYGSALVPLSPGQHVIDVDMYVPLATSFINQFMSWVMGNPPEVRKARHSSQLICPPQY